MFVENVHYRHVIETSFVALGISVAASCRRLYQGSYGELWGKQGVRIEYIDIHSFCLILRYGSLVQRNWYLRNFHH